MTTTKTFASPGTALATPPPTPPPPVPLPRYRGDLEDEIITERYSVPSMPARPSERHLIVPLHPRLPRHEDITQRCVVEDRWWSWKTAQLMAAVVLIGLAWGRPFVPTVLMLAAMAVVVLVARRPG